MDKIEGKLFTRHVTGRACRHIQQNKEERRTQTGGKNVKS